MIKFLFKGLFFLFLLNVNVFSEIINDFDISGNKRISNETIIVLGDLSKNKDFSSSELNNSLRKLYNTNFLMTDLTDHY